MFQSGAFQERAFQRLPTVSVAFQPGAFQEGSFQGAEGVTVPLTPFARPILDFSRSEQEKEFIDDTREHITDTIKKVVKRRTEENPFRSPAEPAQFDIDALFSVPATPSSPNAPLSSVPPQRELTQAERKALQLEVERTYALETLLLLAA